MAVQNFIYGLVPNNSSMSTKDRGLRDVAKKFKISASTVGRMLSGKRPNILGLKRRE